MTPEWIDRLGWSHPCTAFLASLTPCNLSKILFESIPIDFAHLKKLDAHSRRLLRSGFCRTFDPGHLTRNLERFLERRQLKPQQELISLAQGLFGLYEKAAGTDNEDIIGVPKGEKTLA
jgi:hypothetical protein